MGDHVEDVDRQEARRRDRKEASGDGHRLTRIAQVVPDLPTFAVDDGFSYSVPAAMDVAVGSIVRVPLGGRRARGWVTALRDGSAAGLKEIIAVSGSQPIFHAGLLQTLRWAAVHYVAPLAAMLPKAGPPNLPKPGGLTFGEPSGSYGPVGPEVSRLAQVIASGHRPATTFLSAAGPWLAEVATLVDGAASANRSSLIVTPTVVECSAVTSRLQALFGARVVKATSAAPAAERTEAWSQAASSPGSIVVGTPEVALWPIAELAFADVIQEGRRAMKARQTPTLHVREILRRRSSVERIGLLMMGHVPTLETVAMGADISSLTGRSWPLVELIDRSQEPPSPGLLATGTWAAIAGGVKSGQSVFVFVSRRGYAPASRCTNCGELRRCVQCGSNPGRGSTCERCGAANEPCPRCGGATFAPVGAASGRVLEELRRAHGDLVTAAGGGGLIQVGTERDIPPSSSAALAVVIDADSMLLRPHYRAEEETLRVLARVTASVIRGRGHRCVIQSRIPHHRVLRALRHGTSEEILDEWMQERASLALPPFGDILALEIGNAPDDADRELRKILGDAVGVFGPASSRDRLRWLVQAPDLHRAKVQLRPLVQAWRDRRARVRIDVDPVDV